MPGNPHAHESPDPAAVAFLIKKAKLQILSLTKQSAISFDKYAELAFADTFVTHLDSFALAEPKLLLGNLFDQIGFNAIQEELFRPLVITRLEYQVIKLKNTTGDDV